MYTYSACATKDHKQKVVQICLGAGTTLLHVVNATTSTKEKKNIDSTLLRRQSFFVWKTYITNDCTIVLLEMVVTFINVYIFCRALLRKHIILFLLPHSSVHKEKLPDFCMCCIVPLILSTCLFPFYCTFIYPLSNSIDICRGYIFRYKWTSLALCSYLISFYNNEGICYECTDHGRKYNFHFTKFCHYISILLPNSVAILTSIEIVSAMTCKRRRRAEGV